MDNNFKNFLNKVVAKSDRLDMVVKSSGYGFSFWAGLVSIIVSFVMVIASLVGIYLASNVAIGESVTVAGITFSSFLIKSAIVAVFIAIYIAFEFLKTFAFRAFISSLTFNGAFLIGSIMMLSIGYAAHKGYNILDLEEFTINTLIGGGLILFVISNLIAIATKEKSIEWYVIAGIVAVIAVTGATIMANMRTIDIVDKYETQRFKENLEKNSYVVESKEDKSVALGLIDSVKQDIKDTKQYIKDKKTEIAELKAENKKRMKYIKTKVFVDREKALKEQSWKFRTRLKGLQGDLARLQNDLSSLSAKRQESYKEFEKSKHDLLNTKKEVESNFNNTRVKTIQKASVIAIWGEVICSFFIALSTIVHVLNPNIKGAVKIQKGIGKHSDNDIDIKDVRKQHQKSKTQNLEKLLKEEQGK